MRSYGWRLVLWGEEENELAHPGEGFEESFPGPTRSQALYIGAEEWDPMVIIWGSDWMWGETFSLRTLLWYSRLPRETVQFPSSEVFMTWPDKASSSPGLLTLCSAGGAAPSHPTNLWFNHRTENYHAPKAFRCSARPVCLLPEQLLKSRWFKITLTNLCHSCQWEVKGRTGHGGNPCHGEGVPIGLLSQRHCWREAVLLCLTLYLLWAVLACATDLNNVWPLPRFLCNNTIEARTGKAGTETVFIAVELAGSNKSPQRFDFKQTN